MATPRPPWTTERYLSNGGPDGVPPRLPNALHLALTTSLLNPPTNTTYPLPMASNRYISNPNQNRYSTSSTYRYNPHPYLDPGFAEEEDSRAFVDDRNLGRGPGHVLGLPSDRRAETGRSHPDDRYLVYDSTRPWSPAASYETPTRLWPRLNQNAQPRSPAAMDRNYSFTRRASLETRSPISSEHSCPTKFLGIKYLLNELAPINYRGVDRDLPSTSTSHVVSVWFYRPCTPLLIPLRRTCRLNTNREVV